MTSIETFTAFFGWSTVINLALMILAVIILIFMHGCISKVHAKFFGLSESDILRSYFQFLGQYKVAIIMLNLVPYIALKIIA